MKRSKKSSISFPQYHRGVNIFDGTKEKMRTYGYGSRWKIGPQFIIFMNKSVFSKKHQIFRKVFGVVFCTRDETVNRYSWNTTRHIDSEKGVPFEFKLKEPTLKRGDTEVMFKWAGVLDFAATMSPEIREKHSIHTELSDEEKSRIDNILRENK